ncbi:MAG: signal peptidase II [Rhizobiaceae bacterium]
MKGRSFAVATVLVVPFALDLIVKKWAQASLEHGQQIAVIPGLNLTLLYNPGVSFGLFPVGSSTGLMLMLSVQSLLCLGIAIYAWSIRISRLVWSLLLLLSGALANLVDRFFNGAVTDYLDFYVGSSHWPAFNLADVWITLGVVGLIGAEFVLRPRNETISKFEK